MQYGDLRYSYLHDEMRQAQSKRFEWLLPDWDIFPIFFLEKNFLRKWSVITI